MLCSLAELSFTGPPVAGLPRKDDSVTGFFFSICWRYCYHHRILREGIELLATGKATRSGKQGGVVPGATTPIFPPMPPWSVISVSQAAQAVVDLARRCGMP